MTNAERMASWVREHYPAWDIMDQPSLLDAAFAACDEIDPTGENYDGTDCDDAVGILRTWRANEHGPEDAE